MLTTLSELPWCRWDVTKPTLWQLNYSKQLMEETGVIDVEVELSRKGYTELISSLVNLRTYLRKNGSRS